MSIFPNPSPGGSEPPPSMPPAPPSAPPPYGPPPGAPPPYYAAPPQYYAPQPPPPLPASGFDWKLGLLFGIVVALIAANVYWYMQLDKVKKQLTAADDAAQSRIDKLEEATSVNTRTNRKTVDQLREQLERARRQANAAAGEAKDEALKKVDETRATLEAAQAQAKQELSSDISKVRDAADSKISEVGTQVTAVKGDVASTRSELEKTVADLKHATGELDGHSVLIATNQKELSALQALGERNYVQFTVAKAKMPQKVGDVAILLKKADLKKKSYTIELTFDDQQVEKRDRTVNEPVQFYTSKAKQPYEIVVNSVKKDTIVGYLSVPKVLNTRN
jgi:multidrug efflux pump subunit AcrA (membrane-fusion protein)